MKRARLYPFRGKMLPASAISRITGISLRAIRYRGDEGHPVDISRQHLERLYEFRGERRTAKEIAAILGVHRNTVYKLVSGDTVLDPREIQREPRSDVERIFFAGISDTLSGWAKRTGINHVALVARYKRNWPIARMLTEPVHISARTHNKRIITRIHNHIRMARIIAGFNATKTGGHLSTFANAVGTGGGSIARDLQLIATGETA